MTRLSFIIPAYNEEALLGSTIGAIREAARAAGVEYEVIVVDDASDDATARVAASGGARVVSVNHRQIAKTRNAGAAAARGERLFFVDADTRINEGVLRAALRALDGGAAGGSCIPKLEGPMPLYARLMLAIALPLLPMLSGCVGMFVFCTRESFGSAGRFDERLYAGEDAMFGVALGKVGRFVVLRQRVATSARRVRAASGVTVLRMFVTAGVLGERALRRRDGVARLWYEAGRDDPGEVPRTWRVRLSNMAALVLMALLVTLPVWVLPWPASIESGPLGYVKTAALLVLSCVGLALWPTAVYLAVAAAAQRDRMTRVRMGVVLAGMVGLAGLATWWLAGWGGSLIFDL